MWTEDHLELPTLLPPLPGIMLTGFQMGGIHITLEAMGPKNLEIDRHVCKALNRIKHATKPDFLSKSSYPLEYIRFSKDWLVHMEKAGTAIRQYRRSLECNVYNATDAVSSGSYGMRVERDQCTGWPWSLHLWGASASPCSLHAQ